MKGQGRNARRISMGFAPKVPRYSGSGKTPSARGLLYVLCGRGAQSLLQADPGTAAVLGDELDPCGFQGGANR